LRRLNIFAGIYPQDELHIDPNLIHYKELNILGSADSTSYEFREALKLIEDGAVKVEPLISHVLPLEELAKGLDIVAKCGGMKVIMEVEGD
jgi:L-iditol 2-dehydrogenase